LKKIACRFFIGRKSVAFFAGQRPEHKKVPFFFVWGLRGTPLRAACAMAQALLARNEKHGNVFCSVPNKNPYLLGG